MTVLCIAAAACGGGNDSTVTTQAGDVTAVPAQAAPADAGFSGDFRSDRPSDGIAAAGGPVVGGASCHNPGTPADPGAVKIAWVGPNLDELAAIGLESLVLDDPTLVVDAYINTINSQGGLNGQCFELVTYTWGLEDPAADFQHLCSDLPQHSVLLLMGLELDDTAYECATIASQIPTLGIYTTMPEKAVNRAQGRLFLDQGSRQHILSNTINLAVSTGLLNTDRLIGLLYHGADGIRPWNILYTTQRHGLRMAASADTPTSFGDVGILLAERTARVLEGGLSGSERQEAESELSELPPEQAETLRTLESYYLDQAVLFRDLGVDSVVATASWSDVRRFMRAAELVEWQPQWIIDDSQPARLVLTHAPEQQAQNLVQISTHRAAGDPIPELDRGCVSMRNTATLAPPFGHRHHTDAWNLLTATCDYLDVVFSAIARAGTNPTRETFLEALRSTDYDTAYGSRIHFTAEDQFGIDMVRVLRADPNCVLNEWGCMRSTSDWLPADASTASSISTG